MGNRAALKVKRLLIVSAASIKFPGELSGWSLSCVPDTSEQDSSSGKLHSNTLTDAISDCLLPPCGPPWHYSSYNLFITKEYAVSSRGRFSENENFTWRRREELQRLPE